VADLKGERRLRKQFCVYLFLCIAAFSYSAFGQRSKQIHPKKPAKETPVYKSLLPAEYEYRFYLDDKNRLSCSVVSSSSGKYLEPAHISRAMNGAFATGTDRRVVELLAPPKVVVEADASLAMIDVLNVINSVRVSENQEVELRLLDDISLRVSTKPPRTEKPAYPNPLYLQLRIGDKKNLLLNNEERGVFPTFEKLKARLSSVFKERENNGVFRPNTNEVEKTINVVMPMTGYRLSDLILIAQALRDAGSDSLILDIDSYDDVPLERKEIVLP